ncbi:MAG: hypothetical protein ACRDN6_12750 [Gaiellaceae bacterium]
MNADEITLTLPRQQPFYGIAHLVLGGLAVRLDLTFETLEDLQLALAGLLEHPGAGPDVTVSVTVASGAIQTAVGPFEGAGLREELGHSAEGELGLRRLLDTVVDKFDVGERNGETWVELTKNVQAVSHR